jgi:hypothetical protein
MIELRWLRRGTGRQIYDRYGLDADEVETVLQYRQKVDSANLEWSDWCEVPTVDQGPSRVSK